MALAAVQRIDAIFEIERAITGKPAAERLAVRQDLSVRLERQACRRARNLDARRASQALAP